MAHLYNDGSSNAPKLQVWVNQYNLMDLRPDSLWPGLEGRERNERLALDGFEGIQLIDDTPAPEGSTLPFCGLDRINLPCEADPIASKHAARGDACLTVHAGWGMEDDGEVFRFVEAILNASEKYRLPIFIETHRATITQDMWRTVQITKRFPEVRFNGDFSHYYCGQEMVYGDLESKLAFMEPIFARVGFMHGRIAAYGWMQSIIDDDIATRPKMAHGLWDYFADFREIWMRAMLGFIRVAKLGDVLVFAPELLAGLYYYARKFPDASSNLVEESDRYAQTLLYQKIARECFASATQRAVSQL